MKRCSKCREVKALTAFRRDKNRKDGLYPYCVTCLRAYYDANCQRFKEQRKIYRENNRQQKAETDRAYYEANRKKIAEYKRHWQRKNKDAYNTQHRRYHAKNKEKENRRLGRSAKGNRDQLASSYVSKLMRANTLLKTTSIPPSLLEAKREFLKVHRLLKEM